MSKNEEEVKIEEIVSLWKRAQSKFKKAPIMTIFMMLFSGGSLGLSGYVYSIYQKAIEDSMVVAFENPDSEPYKLMVYEIDSIAKVVSKEEAESLKADDLFKNLSVVSKLSNAFAEHKGMEDEEAVEYIANKFEFAEKYQAKDSLMDAVLNFVEILMEEGDGGSSRYVDCGFVKYDTQTEKPKFFVDCDDEQTWRKIRYGRPDDVNLNSGRKIYYYKNEDGKSVIISSISNY